MSSLNCTETKALDNFEACLTSSFSPICHRTRHQLANRAINSVPCENDFSPAAVDSSGDSQICDNVPLEQEVLATVCDMLCHIPSCTPPGTIFYDEGSFYRDEVFPIPLCTSPRGLIYDGSSPPAMSQSFFQEKDSEPVPICEKDEVALFPSDLEVRDLFFDKSPSALFDFVKLSCVQCRRCFASASGLEFHMKDQHDIAISQNQQIVSSAPSPLKIVSVPPPELLQVGPCSGPPQCAPFSKIRPAKTWAVVAAKPALHSSQPWSGKTISFNNSNGPTPRRTIGARLSRPSNARGQSSYQPSTTSSLTPRGSKKPKKISFTPLTEEPDDVSHVVLLPTMVTKKKRRMFTCPRCDFTFRTVKSRDEHLVVHSLEDEFNRLHGIVSSSTNADFPLPKPPNPQPMPKHSNSLSVQNQATTSSTHQAHSSSPATAASLPLICDFCDKRGFPSRKALKYHLFRLHGQPMRKRSQQQASSSLQAHSMTPPAEPTHPASSVQRLEAQISMSLPIQGKIVCPEQGCEASFVSKQWTSMKGSLIKHLRRRKRSNRKTRASSSPLSDTAQDCVTEVSQLLAPPVADVPLVDAAPPPSEHEDEPLFHFSQIFQDILTCDPSHDCARLLSDAYCQLVTEASSIALPKQSVPVPFSQAQPLNIEDPQQCQRLYKRNRRRAIREIQKTAGERCSISPNAVAEYFSVGLPFTLMKSRSPVWRNLISQGSLEGQLGLMRVPITQVSTT
ncbi:hypothetical protein CDAR_617721 [Caerostris darwini]|uniref:C2H2-type domain-containing protein n=1 Tax=Caerostris darwini TaxID=1538125 RepID=A0AAV4RUE4_9ARAC|nr:hypothetical protein CDAR_617721 [Caerostris darwini]